METSPRTFLDAARFAATVLFWPILALVVWGELRLDVPTALQGTYYYKSPPFRHIPILSALAGRLQAARPTEWAVFGLMSEPTLYFILHRRPAPLHRLSGQRGLAAEQAGRQIDNRQ